VNSQWSVVFQLPISESETVVALRFFVVLESVAKIDFGDPVLSG
jgi:hypothetical protein